MIPTTQDGVVYVVKTGYIIYTYIFSIKNENLKK